MKHKKGLIFIFLVICFLSIAGVCASDTGDMDIQTGNRTVEDVVALGVDSQDNDDAVASDEIDGPEMDEVAALGVDSQDNDDAVASQEEIDQNTMAISENDELASGSPFYILQSYVSFTGSGGELNLSDDFSMISGGETVKIEKSITINGNGHTLDGDNINRIFTIAEDGINVTFKNIIFKNGGTKEHKFTEDRGGAILNVYENTFITVINCEFRHNGVEKYGGAIFTNGNLTLVDSKFYKNIVEAGNGGAVFCHGNLFINNTEFEGNEVQKDDGILSTATQLFDEKYYYDGEHHQRPDYDAVVKKLEDDLNNFTHVCNLYLDGGMSANEFKNVLLQYGFTEIITLVDMFKPDALRSILADQIQARKENIEEYKNNSHAPMTGGAIFCEKECSIHNSIFKSNLVGVDHTQIATSGGAIHCRNYLFVHNSTFIENSVNDYGGGAIFSENDCYIYDSSFEDNTANKGCAIYCWEKTNVYNSEFSYNYHIEDSTWLENIDPIKKLINILFEDIPILDKIMEHVDLGTKLFLPSEGGAIWSGDKCIIDSCKFDNNKAMEHGGAIYASSDLTITGQDNIFHHNEVGRESFGGFYKDGGAIYCCGNLLINNAFLYYNTASTDGGAIFCENESNIYNSKFEKNVATWTDLFKLDSCYGGAINTEKLGTVYNCTFKSNTAGEMNSYKGLYAKAGAVYVKSKCNPKFISCSFQYNHAPYMGGAIYMESNDANLNVTSCDFRSNNVRVNGGAIYCVGNASIHGSVFDDHYASKDVDGMYGRGGAIYSENYIALDYCNFTNNRAYSDGGAIHAGTAVMDHVLFEGNYILDTGTGANGGALFASRSSTLSNCNFTDNHASYGGAIFNVNNLWISNCNFNGNHANEGGAVYSNIPPSLTSQSLQETSNGVGDSYGDYIARLYDSSFSGNGATSGMGGAVYVNGLSEIHGCEFIDNSAIKGGGAVYSAYIFESLFNSVFLKNKVSAKKGDGGAIYIKEKCFFNVYSCRFEENKAQNRGGAIFLEDSGSYLGVSYCTFIGNHAFKEDYNNILGTCHGGHSIFNAGNYYDHTLNMCWFGNNAPSADFKEEFVIGHKGGIDKDYTPGNYLKIGIRLNESEIFVGTPYKTTVFFYSSNGAGLDKDLLHSTGIFYGEGQFSNVKADVNDMTADVTFNKTGSNPIHGKLDTQEVTLNDFIVKHKYQSEVRILSCDNVEFPNQMKVTYEITNMSADGASYVIRNSEGEVVVRGNLNAPSGEIKHVYDVRNFSLYPGSYSITITNPETRTTLGSSDNASYNISKGRFGLRIVVFNETYPDEAECIVHADVMFGLMYNLTVTGDQGVVYSSKVGITNRVGHFDIGILDAGNYTATIFCIENPLYESIINHTTFEVSRRGTNFEVEINASEITYGETATVIPILPDGATGNITYHLNDGTFLAKLPYNETLTLPKLNSGSYVIIANYSGDINDLPAFDSVHLLVNPVKTVLEVVANPISYGETAVVTNTLSSDATGNITYYLADGTVLGKLAVGENLTLPVWDVGSYVICANYSGDRNFLNATANVTLIINKAKTAFKVEADPVAYGEPADVVPLLPGNATGAIRYYLSNGTFIIELPATVNLTLISWDAGTYDIVANYSGDRNFLNATANVTLTINKAKTEIMAAPVIVMYNSDGNLLIVLKDIHSSPVGGVNLTVDFNGIKNYNTDKEGQIFLSTNNLRVGTYDVAVSFNGTSNYLNCSNTTNVTVTKMVDTMASAPLVTIYQVHKYLVINLKNELNRPIANEDVIMTINGVSYKCRTDANGNARLIIRLDAKTYMAKITFVNDNYFSATKYVKVTVIKATPKIIAKKKTFKAKKKIKRYKVKLTVHGKALAKVKVTLKIKGKTYKAITNSKGKAVFKIKKLTKKGKYKAKITYKGNYLYNKVTKKVKIRIK